MAVQGIKGVGGRAIGEPKGDLYLVKLYSLRARDSMTKSINQSIKSSSLNPLKPELKKY